MGHFKKLLWRILSGSNDRNISFVELCSVLGRLGFDCRVKGDHFIYSKDGVAEIINIQPDKGKAKPYQVKQVREIILRYRMGEDDDEV